MPVVSQSVIQAFFACCYLLYFISLYFISFAFAHSYDYQHCCGCICLFLLLNVLYFFFNIKQGTQRPHDKAVMPKRGRLGGRSMGPTNCKVLILEKRENFVVLLSSTLSIHTYIHTYVCILKIYKKSSSCSQLNYPHPI